MKAAFKLDANLRRRFEKKVTRGVGDQCHPFKGSNTRDGHGRISVNREHGHSTMEYAHRVALLLDGQKVPDGCEVCHSCNNPPCVNTNHLYVGDRLTNAADMAASGSQKGERNPAATLTDQQCAAIKWLRSEQFRLADISFLFDIHEATVSRIANGKRRAA